MQTGWDLWSNVLPTIAQLLTHNCIYRLGKLFLMMTHFINCWKNFPWILWGSQFLWSLSSTCSTLQSIILFGGGKALFVLSADQLKARIYKDHLLFGACAIGLQIRHQSGKIVAINFARIAIKWKWTHISHWRASLCHSQECFSEWVSASASMINWKFD